MKLFSQVLGVLLFVLFRAVCEPVNDFAGSFSFFEVNITPNVVLHILVMTELSI